MGLHSHQSFVVYCIAIRLIVVSEVMLSHIFFMLITEFINLIIGCPDWLASELKFLKKLG